MSSKFPQGLDVFINPKSNDKLNNGVASLQHSSQHANINDAVKNIEQKVGVNNSTDVNSLDYKVSKSLFSFPAPFDMAKGTPLAVDDAGTVVVGDNIKAPLIFGLAAADYAAGDPMVIASTSLLTTTSWNIDTGSKTLTPGLKYYLATNGMLTSITPDVGSIMPVGIAVGVNTMAVCINPFGAIG